MKGIWKRVGLALVPADDDASESLASLKDGQEIVLDVHGSRNVRFHRMFFALLKKLVTGGLFEAVEDALTAVKVACHEVDVWISPNTGEVYYIPRSIAFEKMDEARFRRLWSRAEYVICTQWNLDASVLREVERVIDGPAAIGERRAA